jgi:hypothetical protein
MPENKVHTAAIALMMEAARTSETSVDNYFTRQYIPEDKSEHHTHRRENLKSHKVHTVDEILSKRFASTKETTGKTEAYVEGWYQNGY